MERIEPQTFEGPRAYFTDFDHRIVSRTRDREKLRRDIERRLKILLLTKNVIVCAASHLTSEFTYRLFQENPVLLHKELIIPALRKDKADIGELFEEKRIPSALKKEMISFYQSEISKIVSWELEENSRWFRDSFLMELKNERSVLRQNLKNLTDQQLRSMILEIEKEPLLGRSKIDSLAATLGPAERRVIINYRELLYHMSGARVVNCESALPQENYIDYSLADIEHRQIILSELQIFWKIFLELAFETMHKTMVPLELLDQLSFEDVCELRQPIENSSFRNTYDELIKKSIESINSNSPNKILYNLHELLLIKDKIVKEFVSALEEELKAFMRRKAVSNVRCLGKSTFSIGLGITEFFLAVPPISSIASLIQESRAFLFNLNQTFNNLQALRDYDAYLKSKKLALESVIKCSEISDKAPLLDVAAMLMNAISVRITF